MKQLPKELANRIDRYEADYDPEQLTAHPRNFRRHPGKQRDALRASIAGHGWVAPVIATLDGTVVDGHARVEEAISAGVKVPVIFVDMDEDEAGSMILRLDPIAAMAEYDADILSELLAIEEWSIEEQPLADLLSFEAGGNLTGDAGEEDDGGASLGEVVDRLAPQSEPGDVWIVGLHRVMCGDSTSSTDAEMLMGGGKAHAMITDPPYGVDYGETGQFRRDMGKGQRAADDSHVMNDGLDDAVELWERCWPVWVAWMEVKSAFYCWGPTGPQQVDLGASLTKAGFALHGGIMWVKSSFSFSRADHKYQHEPAWYGWLQKGTHVWHGPNNESSVWEFDRPSRSELHPTQKPVPLIERCVRNITAPGEVVVDPFGGSGTTAIACANLNRSSRLMEKNPRYCDVIVYRLAKHLGVPAVRESDSTEFDLTVHDELGEE